MSGVEAVAGLALGILPLLISAAEHYDDTLRPFERYKNFAKEADRFQGQLGIQKVIFRNQCRILLEEIIEHDVASSMLYGLSGPTHPSWSDVELEEQLSQLLGESRDACVTTVEMIEQRLGDIDGESQDLATTIHQDSEGVPDPVGSKPWRRRIAKKLRFSFSKPRLDQILCDLRSLNDDFRTLSTQTLKSASLQSQRHVAPPRKPYEEVERYQVIRQASRQVYEALGRACTKHTEHQAHFCVEVEQSKTTGNHEAQVKFSMAYTHTTLAGSTDQSDLIWFAVDSTSGDAGRPGNSDATVDHHDSFSQSLKRQIEPATKAKKRVRFQSAASPSAPTSSILSTAAITNAILSNDSMRKDFCDFIHERLRLAKTLATAVLQYHSTPWLRISWRSEDIYFFDSGLASIQDTPSLTLPHLNVKVKGPCGQVSRASTFPPHNMVRNPLLFNLGVILLEIAYTSNIETLQSPIDLDNGRENRYTEFFAARRLAKSAKSDLGRTYHKIVEKLVECDFGCGMELDDPQLQAAFHRDVICPLEKLVQKLHDFHFD
ncbi:hypothetical protein IMSHALPRED_008261 [Imshaugia aleurites]|uniref:DUF7580 domain-containing protein n=1 Tax=Imshaugia aleurites TaxID=172621 RepID=A0A8H3FTZ7_9LECA|nr:hypothetical protein IMSHALPRED_008261 [Imshaugia aleurites]